MICERCVILESQMEALQNENSELKARINRMIKKYEAATMKRQLDANTGADFVKDLFTKMGIR